METFREYQEWTRTTAVYDPETGVVYTALGLVSEAGEVAGEVKKWLRGDGELDKEALAKEIADCMWYVARGLDELGVSLEDAVKLNVKRLEDRKARNVIKGDGDER